MRVINIILTATASLLCCFQAAEAETAITGTGSVFAMPIYLKWSNDARAAIGVQVNYQGTGPGVGQKQVVAGTVDFGASDVPMEQSKIEASNLRQFPTVVGGLDVIVNLPNVGPNALRLTGPVLANIYMGKITRWNDPQIARLNPDVSLPDSDIIAIHHATASGTTFALSRYLSKVSGDWKTQMGVNMVIAWPGGMGVHGSEGAAQAVEQTQGSIGYAESSYASKNHLAPVMLLNNAGKYVAPNGDTFAAAVANADWASKENFAIDLTDMPGERSWPLVTATFVLAPKNPERSEASAKALKFFGWAFTYGDEAAKSLDYVPLPEKVKQQIMSSWTE